MTTSQRPRRAGSGSRVRRILGRPVRVLRTLDHEQMIMWECFWRSSRAPQPGIDAPAQVRGDHAAADSGSPVPASAGRADRAA
jgi:hypothetical protein